MRSRSSAYGRVGCAGVLLLAGCFGRTEQGALEATPLRVLELRCEHEVDPLAVEADPPRLSWILLSDRRGERQSAWRVLAARTPERLAEGAADLWDSGKVLSDESHLVPYRGRALRSEETVHWKVRVWDAEGRPSPWSEPARFTTALLRPGDWRARWIRFDPPEEIAPPLDPARWIWAPEGDAFPDAAKGAPPGTRRFLRRFEIPAGSAVAGARISVAADNAYEVFLDGACVCRGEDWRRGTAFDVGPRVGGGRAHELSVRVTNETERPSPAGLILRLLVRLEDGRRVEVASDRSWTARREGDAGPEEPALEVARYGEGPWGRVPVVAADAPGLPIARKELAVKGRLRRALLHASGLGQFELFLNGRRVGDRFLEPAWTAYEKSVAYATYDVTEFLRPGANAIGVLLGKGFYDRTGDRRIHGAARSRPLTLILQVSLDYADGSRETLATDRTWRWRPGPLLHDSIHGGCDFDARLLPAGWAEAGFDDARWMAAAEWEGPGGKLLASIAPPMGEREVFDPVSVEEPEPGRFVYDFGQNCSARPRLRARGRGGQTLRLLPAEQRFGASPGRNDGRGRVDQAGIGTPAYVEYTLRGGGEEEWSPPFFYSGYQYLEVSGAVPEGRSNPRDLPLLTSLRSAHVRSAAPTIGEFRCSNALLNAVHAMVDWAVRSNLAHVLTDCPHREKLGWLEVSYLMGPAIAWRYDLSRLYAKVARDIRDSQRADGTIPTVAPDYGEFGGAYGFTTEWGAAGLFVPPLLLEWYGDGRPLEESYASMRRFADRLEEMAGEDRILPDTGLGDWYDYGHGEPPGPSRFTPADLTATATWAMGVRVLAEAAQRLRRPEEEVRRYRSLYEEIRASFRARWFDPSRGVFANRGSPQTANAISLAAGMVDPAEASRALDAIVEDLRARGNQQTAGDVGFRYLLRALADHGRSDVVFDLATRTGKGSYGGILAGAWTSMPESWDADPRFSMQHCMLGHLLEWLQEDLGGIRPGEEPGFRRFVVRPDPVGDVAWAETAHISPYGRIACRWRREGRRFALDLEVPVGTAATVFLPAARAEGIRESGRPVREAPGVALVGIEGGRAVLRLGAGRYALASDLLP
ncbi:MAG TPA: family 78 glycoside hydrolase catalytic domain [Planctomycetota bacterium]|nr:family 78 glycoside hydrolase catalytic domain [Planctomycetota bacterium]